MDQTNKTLWTIGEAEGLFTRCTEKELLLVTRAHSLPYSQRHTAERGNTKIQLDLVGFDTFRDIALLRPLYPTFEMKHTAGVLNSKPIAEALEFDVKVLTQMITTLGKMEAKTERTYRDYTPDIFSMCVDEFTSLQKEASNPFGVFSRDAHGNIYEGWSGMGKRLNVAGVWRRLALSLPYSANFFLRGFEVVSYRGKYNQGYTVPRVISLH